MSWKSAVWAVLLLAISSSLKAQNLKTDVKGKIEPYMLWVSFHKTTNLVFPYSIRSVDRGSNEVIVQKAKGVENVLQLKAAYEGFDETNLTVITGEGALYSFVLNYCDEPELLNVRVSDLVKPLEDIAIFSDPNGNEAVIQDLAKRIAPRKKTMTGSGLKNDKFDMVMELSGIFINSNVMYFQLALENNSHIRHDVSQFRMYIRDRKKSKRTASQEIEIVPLYIEGNVKAVNGQSRQTIVVAVDKFTIPDKKFLRMELMEKNGGRNLALKLGNRQLVQANLP